MTDKLPELRFLLTTSEDNWGPDSQFLHATVDLVQIEEDGRVRNLKYAYPDDPRYGLDDLQITAQMNGGKSYDGRWYGYRLEYTSGRRVDLDRAVAMALTLKRIESRLARLNERFGYPQNFDVWLLRVADVLKVRRFGVVIARRGAGHSYDDHEYNWLDADGLRRWVEDQGLQFGAKFRPADEVPA